MFKMKEEALRTIISRLEWWASMHWEQSKKYQMDKKIEMADYADGRASGIRSAINILKNELGE